MNHPVVLAQFDVASLWGTWASYGAGIWYVDFLGLYTAIDPELTEGIATKAFDSDVGGVLYEGDNLQRVESLTELLTVPSFYWDRANRILYIRLPDFNPPNSTVRVGLSFYVGTEFLDGLNGQVYLPHLKNLPPMTQEKDRLFFKKLTTGSWEMVLDNSGRSYDGMPEWGVYNQIVRYYLGEADAAFEDFIPIRVGRIRDFSFRGSDLQLNVQDLRAQLTVKAPVRTLTIGEYPDLEPSLGGEMKPIAFGRLFGVEPVCLNAEHATGPYVFMLADGYYASIKEITEVRVDGAAVTPSATDLEAGTFTLTSAQVKNGASFKSVRVDFQGYTTEAGALIENPLDVVLTTMLWFARISYSEETFDTTEWNRETIGKPPVALWIDSPIQVLTIVERVMEATRGGLLITPDGRYTWRTPNYEARPKWNVLDIEWIDVPVVEYDTSEVLAFVRVGYRENRAEGFHRFIEDRSAEEEVYNLFNLTDSEEFPLILADEADAATFGAGVMDPLKDLLQ